VSASPPLPLKKPLLPRLGKALALLLITAGVIVGGWVGFKYAKLHLALTHGLREFEKKQLMRAEFWTGRALSVDGKNVEATRLMAEIQEKQDKPTALGWRIRVAQLQPHNPDDIMAWAKCAFRFGQRDMALNALNTTNSWRAAPWPFTKAVWRRRISSRLRSLAMVIPSIG